MRRPFIPDPTFSIRGKPSDSPGVPNRRAKGRFLGTLKTLALQGWKTASLGFRDILDVRVVIRERPNLQLPA